MILHLYIPHINMWVRVLEDSERMPTIYRVKNDLGFIIRNPYGLDLCRRIVSEILGVPKWKVRK